MILVVISDGRPDSDEYIMTAYREFCRVNEEKTRAFTVDRSEGKPFFKDENGRADVYFSLSHSGDKIACAVSKKEVGLDIQEWRELDYAKLSNRLFGYEIRDKREFFDRYAEGEARVKFDGGDLMGGLKKGGGRAYAVLNNYSLAVCGEGNVFIKFI